MSVFSRAVAVLGSVLLLCGLGPVLVVAPAEATSTTLCTGYVGCQKAGMPHAGYKKAGGTMYWRMYAGHNCTNYAAYRMVQSGMPNERPWTGGGNATYWGTSMPDITDGVPAVGAVAWWKANVKPAGSAGHVAYVEQVISDTEIIVSQDSWGGDFSWARITKEGGSWPSGFVHFNDVSLQNVEKPAVVGEAKVGSVVEATDGTWDPSGATFTYQWRANGVDIAAATSPTLKLKLAQQDKRISVLVTATQPGLPTTTVASPKTPAVAPGQITSTVAPSISGVPRVDATLTAAPGSWTPAPSTLAYQWLADGQAVPDATASTFTPGPAHVGKAITVRVTAGKPGYEDVAASSPATAPVVRATFTVLGSPTLSGSPRLGEVLTASPGSVSPAPAELTTTWLRAGQPINGATGPTYTLTEDDLGSRVAARTVLTRPGYTPLALDSPATDLVKTEPTLKVRTKRPGRGRVKFIIRARAPGVDRVSGSLQIVSGGVVLKEKDLGRRGKRSTTVWRLPRGTQDFTVRYLGSDSVLPTEFTKTVRVK